MSKKLARGGATSKAGGLRVALERHVRIKGRELDELEREDVVDKAEETTLAKRPAPMNPLAFAKKVADRRIADAWRRRERHTRAAALLVAGEEKTVAGLGALEGTPDPREAMQLECRRRFQKIAGIAWTEEIAARVREAITPKPSIESTARSLFKELKDVTLRIDRFLAAHGRELAAALDAVGTGLEVPEPRQWGPATDFLRSFFFRLGPLPDVLVSNRDPFPPLSDDPRDRLADLLTHWELPWDRWAPTGPMAPRGIVAVAVLLDLCCWSSLLRPKGLRDEEKELRGRLKTRVGRKISVLITEPKSGRSIAVRVPGPAYVAQIAAKLAEANAFDITAVDLEKSLAAFSPSELERIGKKLAATPDEQWKALADAARRRVQTGFDPASVQVPPPPNDKGACRTQHPVPERRARLAPRRRSPARDAAK